MKDEKIQSNEAKKFNLRSTFDQKLTINPDDVPTLVPEKILSAFMEGDKDPYYKIQAIEYPIMANGYNYTESFFKSFVAKLNRSYIPGSKGGHSNSWGERPPTDILLIGGRIDSVGGGRGTVYLKNYIPKTGESGDNSFFIKENKADNIDYSLVAYTRDERVMNGDGTYQYNVIESMGKERNDAVEYGSGAMRQKTNANESLPNGGEKNNEGSVQKVEKVELFDKLKVLKENAAVSLPEIAKYLGLDALILTQDHQNALAVTNELKQLCNGDPVAFVKTMIEEKKANMLKVREAELTAIVGASVFAESGKKNELREFADVFFGDKEITEANKDAFKKNSIAQKLAGERADWSSQSNVIGASDTSKQTAKIGGAIKL